VADTRLTGLLRHLHAPPGPAAPPTDRDALAAFVARRDEAAFAALVHRHGPMVLRVCRRVLGHQQDAEDAFQATFLVLARKAGTVGRAEALPSWLHGVAFRTAMRARRDAGRRRLRELQAPTGTGSDPADDLAWRDVQTLLEAEVRRLPERYRAPFVLCHLEGRSRAEAAADLGVSENTVSSRLARARDRLRTRLARRGVHLSAVLAAAALTADTTVQALPTEFFQTTIRAGLQFAARQSVTGVTGHTLQLTNGALTTMAVARVKWAAGVFAVGGMLAVGTWGAGQAPGGRPGDKATPPIVADVPGEKPAAGDRDADYAQRQRSLKNLKAIMVAFHAFHDMNNRFPDDIRDKAGKPLLSWRVELLPFLDEDKLYKEIKRDEPWDSPHNFKLLSRMPDVYRIAFDPKDATHTYYQRFAITGPGLPIFTNGTGDGPGAGSSAGPPGPMGAPPAGAGPTTPPAPGSAAGPPGVGAAPEAPPANVPRFPLRIGEITDGLSNTLGVIEAGPPVPWSKPADLVYDAKKPLPPMTGPYANVRHAAMLDGRAVALRPKLDETAWRRLIEPNDGLVLPEWNDLKARFPADSEDEKKALAQLLEDNETLIAGVEEQLREHAALLRLTSKVTKDVERAAEQADELKRLLEVWKLKNRKLRDELGLRPGPVPEKP
jgi:RNA polymerase sigma factor (sigma-70 family)